MDILCLFVPAGYGVWLLCRLKKEKLTWQRYMAWYCNFAIVVNLLAMSFMMFVFESANTAEFDVMRSIKYLMLSACITTVIALVYAYFSKRLKVKLTIENEEEK